jgi:predicted regulator of Ras-like GTPase activity (Roadblock/LC7/MglB family)
MIQKTLEEIRSRVEQFIGVVLTGIDGFAVHKLVPENSNFEQVAIEHVAIIKKIMASMESMDLGGPAELAIIGDKICLLFRSVTPEYFLALGMGPKSSVGRARYELQRASISLRRELML